MLWGKTIGPINYINVVFRKNKNCRHIWNVVCSTGLSGVKALAIPGISDIWVDRWWTWNQGYGKEFEEFTSFYRSAGLCLWSCTWRYQVTTGTGTNHFRVKQQIKQRCVPKHNRICVCLYNSSSMQYISAQLVCYFCSTAWIIVWIFIFTCVCTI